MGDSLERYRAKRDFSRTPEPAPSDAGAERVAAPSFVVQKHAARRLHYDLRLEHDGVLKSWAVTRGPSLDPSDKRLAVQTEDHPLEYGTFEGTIPPKSYGAGTVMVWDRGTWAMVDGKDAEEGFAHGSLSFELFGERMSGRWHLQRLKAEDKRPPQWLLIKSRDEASREDGPALTEAFETSVATGRTMDQIAAHADAVWHSDRPASEALVTKPRAKRTNGRGAKPAKAAGERVPAFVAPALCKPRSAPPRGEDWLAEVKYDGYRMILRAAEGDVRLLTRNQKDWTDRFPAIAEAAAPLASRSVLLDGEVVVFDEGGRTDFGALQRAFKAGGAIGATYVAFDALFADGHDLRGLSIEERKAIADELVRGADPSVLRYGDHVGHGKQGVLFEQAMALGLEGIVAKRSGSSYRSGRQEAWVKVRATKTAPFVIGAYTLAADGSGLGALVAGAYDGDDLIGLGRVGTGFSRTAAGELIAMLEARRVKRSPFATKLEGRGHRFVAPELVANVTYLTITSDGQLRHAAYKGLSDVDAHEVMLPSDHPRAQGDRDAEPSSGTPAPAKNEPEPTPRSQTARKSTKLADVVITNPDKILFPEQQVTKLDLVQHYLAHMERMLPHIEGRPLTLVRCPQGRAKKCFYQRHPEGLPETMGRAMAGEDGDAILVTEPEHVVTLVQRGVLEIHLRGSRVDLPNRPDRLVFDLDPGEGVDFRALRSAAFTLREGLEALDLVSFVKTTGGKGLHVVVPIERRTEWVDAKAFARAFCSRLADAEPERFLISMRKAERHGRIFLDYLRNDRKASAVAPYSSRSREGAPFAMPISWDRLKRARTLPTIHVGEVVRGPDPWAQMASVRQRLKLASALP